MVGEVERKTLDEGFIWGWGGYHAHLSLSGPLCQVLELKLSPPMLSHGSPWIVMFMEPPDPHWLQMMLLYHRDVLLQIEGARHSLPFIEQPHRTAVNLIYQLNRHSLHLPLEYIDTAVCKQYGNHTVKERLEPIS